MHTKVKSLFKEIQALENLPCRIYKHEQRRARQRKRFRDLAYH